ncbi:hypothetical protein [Endozoicomonas numazuensis]|uniref:Uncharacterized protein n=1 Tax=Endozoicomonas numazuensis TaxID=1137799 RepID=A0A081NGK5_9GAMM|nr:hypothetical protein [Endozoicomonas numazuensis]KEQ17058.1 hypothetical protein GZ78_14265 [Endozoicomonas numazuensis]KEQ17578.1 hypothetical protein GZ78_17740 [Endozoicomonas numazuensis]
MSYVKAYSSKKKNIIDFLWMFSLAIITNFGSISTWYRDTNNPTQEYVYIILSVIFGLISLIFIYAAFLAFVKVFKSQSNWFIIVNSKKIKLKTPESEYKLSFSYKTSDIIRIERDEVNNGGDGLDVYWYIYIKNNSKVEKIKLNVKPFVIENVVHQIKKLNLDNIEFISKDFKGNITTWNLTLLDRIKMKLSFIIGIAILGSFILPAFQYYYLILYN